MQNKIKLSLYEFSYFSLWNLLQNLIKYYMHGVWTEKIAWYQMHKHTRVYIPWFLLLEHATASANICFTFLLN